MRPVQIVSYMLIPLTFLALLGCSENEDARLEPVVGPPNSPPSTPACNCNKRLRIGNQAPALRVQSWIGERENAIK
jgi:hypothetical protein